jgi:hypothetical protein
MLLSPISDDPGFEMFAHVTVVSCTIVHGPDVRAAPRVAIQLAREFSIVTPGTKTLIHPLTSLAFTTPAVDTFRSPETLDNTVPTGTPVHDTSGYAGNGHVVNEPDPTDTDADDVGDDDIADGVPPVSAGVGVIVSWSHGDNDGHADADAIAVAVASDPGWKRGEECVDGDGEGDAPEDAETLAGIGATLWLSAWWRWLRCCHPRTAASTGLAPTAIIVMIVSAMAATTGSR